MDLPPIKIESAQTSGIDDFEASVLAGLDRQVGAQKSTLAALRAKYNEDYPDVETAKLNLAILQARRDALARTNADRANIRVAALLDPGRFTRGAVKPGDQITITGAPARSSPGILQATEASANSKPLFSRPAVELSRDAVVAYEK